MVGKYINVLHQYRDKYNVLGFWILLDCDVIMSVVFSWFQRLSYSKWMLFSQLTRLFCLF